MITKQAFTDYLYGLFPEDYRTEDAKTNYTLKKYLTAIVDGGFSYILDKINSFTGINDPEKCPDELFPILYRSMGLTYEPSIDIKYQRKILKNIGELNRRRGTYSSIKYLARVLAQTDIKMTEEKVVEEGVTVHRVFTILLCDTLEQIENMDNSIAVVQHYIQSWMPYNTLPIVKAEIRVQVLESKQYYANAISQSIRYDLTFN